jgi:hypothetical protein
MDKIRNIRVIIGEVFKSPMSHMNYPQYFQYINTTGKITARSLMEVEAVILTFLEEQEKVNLQNEENFKQIFEILAKIVNNEVSLATTTPVEAPKTVETEMSSTILPDSKELLRQKRIANLQKAREARKLKTNPTSK